MYTLPRLVAGHLPSVACHVSGSLRREVLSFPRAHPPMPAPGMRVVGLYECCAMAGDEVWSLIE